jgi:hypothetical protein
VEVGAGRRSACLAALSVGSDRLPLPRFAFEQEHRSQTRQSPFNYGVHLGGPLIEVEEMSE